MAATLSTPPLPGNLPSLLKSTTDSEATRSHRGEDMTILGVHGYVKMNCII
jgi:hypothetical protein